LIAVAVVGGLAAGAVAVLVIGPRDTDHIPLPATVAGLGILGALIAGWSAAPQIAVLALGLALGAVVVAKRLPSAANLPTRRTVDPAGTIAVLRNRVGRQRGRL